MSLANVNALLREGFERLDDARFEPSGERASAARGEIDALRYRVRDELIGQIEATIAEVVEGGGDGADGRRRLNEAVVTLVLRLFPAVYATGQTDAAVDLIGAARPLAVGDDEALLSEGLRDPASLARLGHAWWRQRNGDLAGAKVLAKPLVSESIRVPAIAAAARAVMQTRKPLKSAPALFTLNGFGLKLYGDRDRRDDGSYVTTRYVTALFVPVLPIDAFRVAAAPEGGWYFLERTALSTVGRMWQGAALLAVLVGGGTFAASTYFGSDSYKLSVAVARADALEQAAADPAGRQVALEAWEAAVAEFCGRVSSGDLDPATTGVARMALAEVPEPFEPVHADTAQRAARRYLTIAPTCRSNAADAQMAARLQELATGLGEADAEHVGAAVALLETAREVVADDDAIEARRDTLRRHLADGLVEAWPLAALRLYADIGSAEVVEAAGQIVTRLPPSPSVWAELQPELTWFHRSARASPTLAGVAGDVLPRLEKARAFLDDPARAALLQEGDDAALAAHLRGHPNDHEVAALLAEMARQQGEIDAAEALLRRLGSPGELAREAALSLARTLADKGAWTEAEAQLEQLVGLRLVAYKRARREYSAAASDLEDRLIQRARRGDLPPELERKMEHASQEEVDALFGAYLREKFASDTHVGELADAAQALSDVVPVVLELGMLRLRHAGEVAGAERTALLTKAEQAFLSIQDDAGGLPEFHLSLGQVYHRLGKAAEGDAEFDALLEQGDPDLSLAVARTCRALGLETKARAIATQIADTGDTQHRYEAAMLMALMANDLDDKEAWLRRSDPSNEFVETNLLEVEGNRLLRDGDRVAADARFAEAAAVYERDAARNSASANNAALDYRLRFQCTGNLAHLRKASSLLDQALALQPDNAIAYGNAASVSGYLGTLEVLGRWIDGADLQLHGGEASGVLSWLGRGPLRSEVQAAVRRSPALRRTRDQLRQAEILAPQRPDAYSGEAEWAVLLDDLEQLRGLLARLEGVSNLDTAAWEASQAAFLAGDDDAMLDGLFQARIAAFEALDDLPARSRAVALGLVGGNWFQRAVLSGDPDHMKQAVEAIRAGSRLWPEAGIDAALVGALLHMAWMNASLDDPVRLRRDLRDSGVALAVLECADEGLKARARARPELAEAAALVRARGARGAYTASLAIAALTGDAEVERLALEAVDEAALLDARIDARLTPNPATARMLQVIEARSTH